MSDARVPTSATLVPLGAFLLALGLAWGMTAGAESSPETTLHRAVHAYHEALRSGDVSKAARFVPDDARTPRGAQALRAEDWRGTREWALASVRLAEGGTEAVATVWRLEGPRTVVVEEESWARRGEGAWGLVRWEEVGRKAGH